MSNDNEKPFLWVGDWPPQHGRFNCRGDYVMPDGSKITAEEMGHAPNYPYGPDAWVTESNPTLPRHNPFDEREASPRRYQALAWEHMRARLRDGPPIEFPTAADLRAHISNPAIVIAPKSGRVTTGRLTGPPLPKGFTHGGQQVKRKPSKLRIAALAAVGLGFLCAALCIASWGVALATDAPQAWAASMWFLGAALAFEVAAFGLQLLEGRR